VIPVNPAITRIFLSLFIILNALTAVFLSFLILIRF
jgi:hypothetical protein